MKLTVDIVEEFLGGLAYGGLIICSDVIDGFTYLRVYNPLHARKGLPIYIDGIKYVVYAVNYSTNTIVIEGELVSPMQWTISAPFYFHGTPTSQSKEIGALRYDIKVPMVFLPEVLTERDMSLESAVKREADLRLFFLDVANYRDWSIEQHYQERLIGMNYLVDYFVRQLLNDRRRFKADDVTFTRRNHAKWGQVQNRGHVQSIFDERLSGVELTFTLKMRDPCFKPKRPILCSNSLTNASETYTQPSKEYKYGYDYTFAGH